MNILVTGASGFIGGHVLRLLTSTNHNVFGFDKDPLGPIARSVDDQIQHIRGDVTDPRDVRNTIANVNPDCIIHLASLLVADCRNNPRRAFEINVGGTANILEAVQENDVRRVVAGSSVNVYGTAQDDAQFITETTIRNPNSTYGMTKYAIEWLGTTYDVEFTALEPVHGFGPERVRGNAYDAVIVKAAVSGNPISIPNPGITEEFLYVEDSAQAFVAAAIADRLTNDRYLVGTDQRFTIAEFVDHVAAIVPDAEFQLHANADDHDWIDDRNSHPPTDSSRIRRDLGWVPSYTLNAMVNEYVEWLEENPNEWSFTRDDIPWSLH